MPPSQQPVAQAGKTVLKKRAWLASHVCVFPGVTIGEHAIIGAHSVVNKDIPDFCVAFGNPAKVVRRYDHDRKEWVAVKD